MKILLIGNFSPPYEEEALHNLTLLHLLKQEGNECHVLNIAESSQVQTAPKSNHREITDIKNYFDFVTKLIRYGFRSNAIHFLTKGYTRPGLMKLMTTIVIGRLLLTKVTITLYPEMFSIFGRLRSKMGGQQLLRLSFSLANSIICGDIHTCDIALLHHKIKDKFKIMPTFIKIPEKPEEKELLILKKLENKKRVIVFSNVTYPSFIFEILNNFLAEYSDHDTGIAISLFEKNPIKLQHAIEEVGGKSTDNMVFIEPNDNRLLSMVYANANLVIRTLSCDGKRLFEDIAVSIKKPVCSGNFVYFPLSLLLIKEGDVSELCSYIFDKLLSEKPEKTSERITENLQAKIKEIYLGR